jgi:hypothetical protein
MGLAWVCVELGQYTDRVLNVWAGLSDIKDGAYALKVDYAVRALSIGRAIFWGCGQLQMRESSSNSKGGGCQLAFRHAKSCENIVYVSGLVQHDGACSLVASDLDTKNMMKLTEIFDRKELSESLLKLLNTFELFAGDCSIINVNQDK